MAILLGLFFGPITLKTLRDYYFSVTVDAESYQDFLKIKSDIIQIDFEDGDLSYREYVIKTYGEKYALLKSKTFEGREEYGIIILNTSPNNFPGRGCHLLYPGGLMTWLTPGTIKEMWDDKIN